MDFGTECYGVATGEGEHMNCAVPAATANSCFQPMAFGYEESVASGCLCAV